MRPREFEQPGWPKAAGHQPIDDGGAFAAPASGQPTIDHHGLTLRSPAVHEPMPAEAATQALLTDPESFAYPTGSPLLVVQIDDPVAATAAADLATVAPCVVIGVLNGSPTAQQSVAASHFDMAIAAGIGAQLRPPWIRAAGGLDAALDPLVARIGERPIATTTLVQVLRAQRGCSMHDALTIESLAYSTLLAGAEHRAWLATHGHPAPQVVEGPAMRVDRSGTGAAVITLDRPDVHNAFGARMRDDLVAALHALSLGEPTIPIVLRGTGPTFSSGGDLREFGAAPDPATAHATRTARSAARWIALLAERTTAELHGECIGAGVELPAFAGTVVAAPGTTFRLPEVAMGLIPGAGGTVGITRRIGRQRTAWLALTGNVLDASTAKEWGLVDAVDDTAW